MGEVTAGQAGGTKGHPIITQIGGVNDRRSNDQMVC